MPIYFEDTYQGQFITTGLVLRKAPTAAGSTTLTAGGALMLAMGSGATVPNVYAGSGVPTVSAPQGSLYLRSDGNSTSTRMYINTNGTTGWTNVTTAT